jgi:hypothetical protein
MSPFDFLPNPSPTIVTVWLGTAVEGSSLIDGAVAPAAGVNGTTSRAASAPTTSVLSNVAVGPAERRGVVPVWTWSEWLSRPETEGGV